MSMTMPESIASLFHHQSPMHSHQDGKKDGGPGDGRANAGEMTGAMTDQDPPRPPSPINIPRAQISKGDILIVMDGLR